MNDEVSRIDDIYLYNNRRLLGPALFSSESIYPPNFKTDTCDPQYCYYWRTNVAWMPGQYACDASDQLWKCNERQDITQHCTTQPPVYDSPTSLDEELPWIRVDMPTIPAAAPENRNRDCLIHDASNASAKYFFQVGDLVCKEGSSRIWSCLNEERCNDLTQVPWEDDLIALTYVNGETNTADVDGKEPAWMLTHYIANPENKKALQRYNCVDFGSTWDYTFNFLMNDCVLDDNDIVWVCKHPELCHLIDVNLPLFNAADLNLANPTTTSVHQRYGVGVWMPKSSLDSSAILQAVTQPALADGGCFRGDAFPPNEPFRTGDKVCVQPTSYGPYRYEADGTTGDDLTFTWDPEEATKTNNNGFRRVFECVGGDMCNKIYPLEDLYRHLPNADNGEIFQFIGSFVPIFEIEETNMSAEELLRTRSSSQTVWKLTRENFPLFTDERTAFNTAYDAAFDPNLTADQKANDVTQMTTAVTHPANPSNILSANKNWWPKYVRKVYEYSTGVVYLEGDFVYVA